MKLPQEIIEAIDLGRDKLASHLTGKMAIIQDVANRDHGSIFKIHDFQIHSSSRFVDSKVSVWGKDLNSDNLVYSWLNCLQEVAMKDTETCPECKGTRVIKNDPHRTCGECHGAGFVMVTPDHQHPSVILHSKANHQSKK